MLFDYFKYFSHTLYNLFKLISDKINNKLDPTIQKNMFLC